MRRLIYGHTPTGDAILRLRSRLDMWTDPDCDSPVHLGLFEGQRDVHPTVRPAGLEWITVPCRKCKKCRLRRSRMWYARMRTELEWSTKSWFLTLTWGTGTPGDYREIQLFLKRLRKIQRVTFCAVQERGDKGRLHWHMLLHCNTLTKRQVQSCWQRVGFSGCKLATPETAGYISGYAADTMLKVHASKSYGKSRE